MRILKGLSSRQLPCGCVVGIYETYEGTVIFVVDSRAGRCGDREHVPGRQITLEPSQRARPA